MYRGTIKETKRYILWKLKSIFTFLLFRQLPPPPQKPIKYSLAARVFRFQKVVCNNKLAISISKSFCFLHMINFKQTISDRREYILLVFANEITFFLVVEAVTRS